jgi:hypothetical protein
VFDLAGKRFCKALRDAGKSPGPARSLAHPRIEGRLDPSVRRTGKLKRLEVRRESEFMPSRPARRADDKRLRTPGQKAKNQPGGEKGPRTRMERYLAGELKVSEMDDKELKKGMFRNKEGGFKGRPPNNIPRKFYNELDAERIKRWNDKVKTDLEPMREVLREIALNPRASADARHKSAVYLIERAVGKVPDKGEVKIEMAPWEANIQGILVHDNEEEADDDQ